MKDYSLKKEDSAKFIRSYRIDDGEGIHKNEKWIYITFGSEKKPFPTPYTQENEQKVLNKMEEQVLNSNPFEQKVSEKYRRNLKNRKFGFMFAVLSGIVLGITFSTGTGVVPSALIFCFLVFFTAIQCSLEKRKTALLQDIEKNKLFLENEEKLNKRIKVNQQILSGISHQKEEDLNRSFRDIENGEWNPKFTLNSIDDMSYEELKQIIMNMEREEMLDLDYEKSKGAEYVKK